MLIRVFLCASPYRYLTYLGPDVYMLLLDCRAERKKDQVCSKLTYDRVFAAIKALPQLKHLVFQLGIPIAYRAQAYYRRSLPLNLPLTTALLIRNQRA